MIITEKTASMSKFKFQHAIFISLLSAFTFFFTTNIYAAGHDSGRDLQLGCAATNTAPDMVKRLTPLTKYLSSKTGIKVKFHDSSDLNSAVDKLGVSNLQIAYLSPDEYLEAHEKYAVVPLVNPLKKGKSSFTLVIAVPKDSPVQTVSDLHGKKFAFGDKKSTLQPAIVEKAGVKTDQFSSYDYLDNDDNIATAVLNGGFDAGILKDTVAEKYKAQGMRVIYTSAPIPSYLFAVNKNLPPITVNMLKNAMLGLNGNTKENKAILAAIEQGYDGVGVAKDKDFDEIRKLLAAAK
ncbi:MAG TPA: phosphate/phosphite/phosphonate ABC transporter substrate-binding protein [Gallionellaceae bacterium]|nr:phosphate/phosphite/phosphonate ABC transporter substrate-binding protein [Gallionellaceae bacterium]